MNKIKAFLTIIGLFAITMAPAAIGSSVVLAATEANIQNSTCAGGNLDANQISTTGDAACVTSNEDSADNVNKIVGLVINIFSWVVGVVAVIAIIIGGFKYITSGGSSEGVTGAKNTILYAIVGLVIVAIAQLIVRFVLGNVTSATTQ